MSTTGLDAATLARSLRRMAGDGSVEWVMEPIQSSVLRDIADMLDENAKLRELVIWMYKYIRWSDMTSGSMFSVAHSYEKDMRELGIEAK